MFLPAYSRLYACVIERLCGARLRVSVCMPGNVRVGICICVYSRRSYVCDEAPLHLQACSFMGACVFRLRVSYRRACRTCDVLNDLMLTSPLLLFLNGKVESMTDFL